MANLNKVLLIGRLTQDPELKYTPAGAAVCDFRLATSRVYTTPDGERRDEPCFIDIAVWRRQAETCAQYLKKGSEIFVEGYLTLDRWEAPDGQKRSKLRVTALRVQFLGRAPKIEQTEAPEPDILEEEPPF
jgi:single-strand DNA-binding protein